MRHEVLVVEDDDVIRGLVADILPIVVFSVNPALPRSFDQLGVVRCIGKPFEVDDLAWAVGDAVGANSPILSI